MSKFAKLFDIEDEDTQVLYVLKTNNEGHPQVEISSLINGVHIAASPTFGPKDNALPFNDSLAWKTAQQLFDSKDQNQAFIDYESLVNVVKG